MDAKEFLKQKGISNNDFMDSGVADLIETLLTEYQALQLQQTGVISTLKSCTRCSGDGTYKLSNNLVVICGVCDGKGVKEDFNYL